MVGMGVPVNLMWEEQAYSGCLVTSNACQTKSWAVDTGKRENGRGGGTIPRPSFTNYAEYLLTSGLSPCLRSHPTLPPPNSFATSHHFPPRSVAAYQGLQRGSSSHLQASRGDKGKGVRGSEAEEGLELGLWFGKHFRGMMKRLSEFRWGSWAGALLLSWRTYFWGDIGKAGRGTVVIGCQDFSKRISKTKF